jgi:hypothetical protein
MSQTHDVPLTHGIDDRDEHDRHSLAGQPGSLQCWTAGRQDQIRAKVYQLCRESAYFLKSLESTTDSRVHLFDNWFNPIESGVRERVREFILLTHSFSICAVQPILADTETIAQRDGCSCS